MLENKKDVRVITRVVLGVVFFTAIISSSFGISPINEEIPPDYSNWDVIATEATCILNNQRMALGVIYYNQTYDGKDHLALVILNEVGQPWLFFYAVGPNLERSWSGSKLYLFESDNNDWKLIKEFTPDNSGVFAKELRKIASFNYKLSCKL